MIAEDADSVLIEPVMLVEFDLADWIAGNTGDNRT